MPTIHPPQLKSILGHCILFFKSYLCPAGNALFLLIFSLFINPKFFYFTGCSNYNNGPGRHLSPLCSNFRDRKSRTLSTIAIKKSATNSWSNRTSFFHMLKLAKKIVIKLVPPFITFSITISDKIQVIWTKNNFIENSNILMLPQWLLIRIGGNIGGRIQCGNLVFHSTWCSPPSTSLILVPKLKSKLYDVRGKEGKGGGPIMLTKFAMSMLNLIRSIYSLKPYSTFRLV